MKTVPKERPTPAQRNINSRTNGRRNLESWLLRPLPYALYLFINGKGVFYPLVLAYFSFVRQMPAGRLVKIREESVRSRLCEYLRYIGFVTIWQECVKNALPAYDEDVRRNSGDIERLLYAVATIAPLS
jgi:hypothetical protein